MTRKDQSRREQFAKVILDNALKNPSRFASVSSYKDGVVSKNIDTLFKGVIVATDKFMAMLGDRVPDKVDAASPFNKDGFHDKPNRRVEGTVDPDAPMPYNPEDLKDLDIDSMIDRAIGKVVRKFSSDHPGVPVAITLDVDAREDIKKSLEEIMKGQPWQVLNEYGTGGKRVREEGNSVLIELLRASQEQLGNAHKEVRTIQEQNAAMESDLETQNNEVLRLRREVVALNTNLKSITEHSASLQVALDQKNLEVDRMLGDLQNLRRSLKDSNSIIAELRKPTSIREEAPAPAWLPWFADGDSIYQSDGRTSARIGQAHRPSEASFISSVHNKDMERISKR